MELIGELSGLVGAPSGLVEDRRSFPAFWMPHLASTGLLLIWKGLLRPGDGILWTRVGRFMLRALSMHPHCPTISTPKDGSD